MKTRLFICVGLTALTVALLPCSTLSASETAVTDSVQVSLPAGKTSIDDMTINGRPATKQEKAVAREIVRKGTKMAGKGTQLAVAAVTNPKKAEKIADEMEALGSEMEHLGDSLETLAEDTTFLWEADDSLDEVMDSDIDDFVRGVSDALNSGEDAPWYLKLMMGAFGLLIVAVVLCVLLLLFLLFTSPIWVLALIIYLVVKSSSKSSGPRPTAPQTAPAASATSSVAEAASGAAPSDSGDGSATLSAAPSEAAATAATADAAAITQPEGSLSVAPAPSDELYAGIRQCALGVGLIILFLVLGLRALWGIGALVVCLGMAKVIIYYVRERREEERR